MDAMHHIKTLAKQYLDEVIQIRRHIHAHPELSFEEYKTAAFVAEKLEEFGLSYKSGLAGTGIVATLEGNNPKSKKIILRADLDALPIKEENNVSYKSKHEGVMHACGHDVHTSSLLGAAKILANLPVEWEGSIDFLFQPGEEKLPGGASLMIKEGVLDHEMPFSVLGQHVYPEMQVGKVGFRPGMYMASTDEIFVKITGKGGHAALPAQHLNPIPILSEIILELPKLLNENVPEGVPHVFTIGKFEANGATNIVPEDALCAGTLRTMNEQWRQRAHELIEEKANEIADKYGAKASAKITKGYPFLVNDEQTTQRAMDYASAYLGAENVIDLDLRMTAEDFAYYSQKAPCCFYRLGVGNEEQGITSSLHNPRFNIDERALETGMGLMSWIAYKELEQKPLNT